MYYVGHFRQGVWGFTEAPVKVSKYFEHEWDAEAEASRLHDDKRGRMQVFNANKTAPFSAAKARAGKVYRLGQYVG